MTIRAITPVPEKIADRVNYRFTASLEGAPHELPQDTAAEAELLAQALRRLLHEKWPDRWSTAHPDSRPEDE